ncbi:hypothetical protein NPIL_678941 [Nephila pilipes]|uniref:Uncharacterized protein n=1 Tax=Nephila pilipes TaxID=299642 RepID=A0A8X6Q7G9_NEPPI|nr:hypothetical protein NPIL_678941 [Nephila pilipes]
MSVQQLVTPVSGKFLFRNEDYESESCNMYNGKEFVIAECLKPHHRVAECFKKDLCSVCGGSYPCFNMFSKSEYRFYSEERNR